MFIVYAELTRAWSGQSGRLNMLNPGLPLGPRAACWTWLKSATQDSCRHEAIFAYSSIWMAAGYFERGLSADLAIQVVASWANREGLRTNRQKIFITPDA